MSAITAFKQIAYNRSRRTSAIQYIVVHDTGNTDRGADAERHYQYFNGGDRGSSADVFVDDHQAIQVNDYNKYYTWHCGDGHGAYGITNANSIGVEMCINWDGDYTRAFNRTVEVVRELMVKLGIDANHVVRHYDASRKNCPMSMSGNNWARWRDFKKWITESEGLSVTQYEELKAEIDKLKAENEKFKNVIESTFVYDYNDKNVPDWARDALTAAIKCGAIKGDDKDELNLSYKDLRTIVREYRCGLYD